MITLTVVSVPVRAKMVSLTKNMLILAYNITRIVSNKEQKMLQNLVSRLSSLSLELALLKDHALRKSIRLLRLLMRSLLDGHTGNLRPTKI